MVEVRIQVEDSFWNNLKRKLGTSQSTGVMRDAFTILNWAVEQKLNGREIVSLSGGEVDKRLDMPSLRTIKAASPPAPSPCCLRPQMR